MEEPKRNAKDQKHCKTEIRNAFNEFSRLGTTEKRISELSTESSKIEKQGEQRLTTVGHYKKYNTHIMGILEKEERTIRNI